MSPVFEAAKKQAKRIVYGEGEDERVLRAVQTLLDERIAQPILLGRRDVIERRVREMGLRMDLEKAVRVLDPEEDTDVFGPLAHAYQLLVGRRGSPPDAAARHLATRPTIAAAMLLQSGQADAAICGGSGNWWRHIPVCASRHSALSGGNAGLRALLPHPAKRCAVRLRHAHAGRSDRRSRSPK